MNGLSRVRYVTVALACLVAICIFAVSVQAESNVYVEPSTTLVNETITVPPGRFASYKLPLTQGTTVVASFMVEGGLDKKVDVRLLDLPNFQAYQARQPASFIKGTSGTVQSIAKYSVKVPDTNVYHLVVDNQRSQLLPRKVTIYAYGVLPEPTPESLKAQQVFETFYKQLKDIFVFQDFQISIRHCGFENAFSNSKTGSITLCKELISKLGGHGLNKAVAFVLLHELGHSFLNLWGYPMADNEDAADEFATVFMLLTKQQDAALQAAQWWASDSPTKQKQEALSKLIQDDRHTLSPQRARNIIRWLNQREALFQRWQKVFVPNMQTTILTSLDKGTESWIDHALVRSELAKRNTAQK